MRILLLIKHLGIGGVQTYLVHLACSLASAGHDLTVYTHYPYASDAMNLERLRESAAVESPAKVFLSDFFYWKLQGISQLLGIKARPWQAYMERHFLNTCQEKRVEAIISFDRESDALACGLKPAHGLPVLLSLHGNYDPDPADPFTAEALAGFRLVFSRANGIVYKTAANLSLLRQLGPFPHLLTRHIRHAYKPFPLVLDKVQLRDKHGLPRGAFVFSMIARGDPSKGWHEVLEAFLLLSRLPAANDRPIRLVCQGNGPYMLELRKKYQGHPGIHFVSPAVPTAEIALLSDIGLLPSYFRTENYSYSLIEFLYYGVPLIVSDHGLLAETLGSPDGPAGILLPLQESGGVRIDDLREAMSRVLENGQEYLEYVNRAEKAFRKFQADQAASAYAEVLQAIRSQGAAFPLI